MQNGESEIYQDTRNVKRRKYLKYNNKCGYSRKGSPECPFCHPKRKCNTGIIDGNVFDRLHKNTKKNVYINIYAECGNNKSKTTHAKVRLLTSSYY